MNDKQADPAAFDHFVFYLSEDVIYHSQARVAKNDTIRAQGVTTKEPLPLFFNPLRFTEVDRKKFHAARASYEAEHGRRYKSIRMKTGF